MTPSRYLGATILLKNVGTIQQGRCNQFYQHQDYVTYIRQIRTQWVRKCIDGCASPCEERVSYSASITTHDFPSQNSKDKLIEFVNTEFKLELNLSAADSVLVDIFYSQLR